MGRHPDGATPRTERIAYRITPEGLAMIELAAARAGETVSTYARKAAAMRARDDLQQKAAR